MLIRHWSTISGLVRPDQGEIKGSQFIKYTHSVHIEDIWRITLGVISVIVLLHLFLYIKRRGPLKTLTNQDREVVENTRSRVKINTKLTNFKIKSQIKGHSGE